MSTNGHEQRMFSDPIYRRSYQQAEREGLAVLERRELRRKQREGFLQHLDAQRDFLIDYDRQVQATFDKRAADLKRINRRQDLILAVALALGLGTLMILWMLF